MNAPLGSGITNCTPNSLQTLTVPDTAKNGYYYNKTTGKLEGHLTTKTGDVNDVYACTGKIGDGECATYSGAVKLDIKHDKFQICAKIVMRESGAPEEKEFLYVAYATFNASHQVLSHIYSKLMTGYSSVPSAEKTALADTVNSNPACFARKGLISVFMCIADPTSGANYWDGTDFLAWGLNSPYQGGVPHAKFRQSRSILIPKSVYDQFLSRTLEKYPSGHVSYFGSSYNIPAAVFLDAHNWTASGDFYYETGHPTLPKLEAQVTAGHTVFWKKTPD